MHIWRARPRWKLIYRVNWRVWFVLVAVVGLLLLAYLNDLLTPRAWIGVLF